MKSKFLLPHKETTATVSLLIKLKLDLKIHHAKYIPIRNKNGPALNEYMNIGGQTSFY